MEAPGSSHGRADRPPQSIEQITKDAGNYDFNAMIGIKYWLRSAKMMLQQARIYKLEGNDEETYFLLFRYAHLVLTNLARHPQSTEPQFRRDFAEAKDIVNQNFAELDRLKPRITRRYDRYQARKKEVEAEREAAARARNGSADAFLTEDEVMEDDIVRQIHAQENQAFAVELAKEEYLKREASRRERPRRSSNTNERDDLSDRMRQVYSQNFASGSQKDQSDRHRHTGSQYNYPEVHHRHATSDSARFDSTSRTSPYQQRPSPAYFEQDHLHESAVPPRIPAKYPSQPALPPKPASITLQHPTRPEKVAVDPPGSKLGPSKPTYMFKPTAFLESGKPLRTLFLPPTLRTTFLRTAHSNTLKNLETCAFLAGTLIANALFVSKLIIPAQTATSDTCEMINESQLFDYVDSQPDLMVVGWIHTHPRQTCFMSSRDLHTHSGYQMMLLESVAIVCAPSFGDTSHGGDWGAFRLTDPPGKGVVLACEKPGLFHPHDVDNIYTDALRPGHVVEAAGLDFEVVDLREKPA